MNAILDFLRVNAADILNLWFTMQLQTAVFVLLVLLVERSLPARWSTPRFRYLLWMTVLVKAVIPPVLSLPGAEVLPAPVYLVAPVAVAGAAAPEASVTFSTEMLILIALFGSSLALAGMAAWRAMELRRRLRDALPFEDAPAGDWPPILISTHIPSPLATGIRRPRIYITPAIAEAPRDILLAVLQHERAHLRRHDGIVVLLQTLAQVAYALNPMMWFANLRIFRYRELICDEEALRRTGTRPQDYGRLLLNFAEAQPARLLQTGTCFFETRRGFVQRITELFKAGQHSAMKWKHYALVIAFSLVILPLSWRCSENAPKEADVKDPLKIEGMLPADTGTYDPNKDYTAEILGGIDELRKHLVYPEKAREKKLEGIVVVEVTIKRDGSATAHRIRKSVDPLLDAAALDAVRGLHFRPAVYKGETYEMTMQIPIKFKLH